MDNKKPYETPHMQRPEHHLFTNFRLNEMFCQSLEDSTAWAASAIKVFEDHVTDLPEKVKADFLSYAVAATQVAFEWGFKKAIDEVVDLTKENKKHTDKLNNTRQ